MPIATRYECDGCGKSELSYHNQPNPCEGWISRVVQDAQLGESLGAITYPIAYYCPSCVPQLVPAVGKFRDPRESHYLQGHGGSSESSTGRTRSTG